MAVIQLSPIMISPVFSISGDRRSLQINNELKGFKINSFFTRNSHGSLTYKYPLKGEKIVCQSKNTSVQVPAVDDDTWESLVLESASPVLVEFWAPWCGPCRMIHPVIDALAKDYVGKLKCYKVNTDESPTIASKYGIRSIPTVVIFKDGDRKDAIIGAVAKTTLATSIEKFL